MSTRPSLTTSSSSSINVAVAGTQEIKLSDIFVPERLRQLRPEKVEVIIESMQDVGLLEPIIVRLTPEGPLTYELVIGNHRLEAHRKLGFATIRADIKNLTKDEAQLAEIDENLVRAELTPAERADHVHRRKEIYERLHPDTTHGGDRKSISQLGILRDAAFIDATAKKTGKGRSTIARDDQRAKNIPEVGKLAHTSLDSGVELDATAKLPPEQQKEIISKAKKGEKVSAQKTLKSNAGSSAGPSSKVDRLIDNFSQRVGLLKKTVDEISKEKEVWRRAIHNAGENRVRDLVSALQKAHDDHFSNTNKPKKSGTGKSTHH